MSPDHGIADAWVLTRAISPRDRVRVAAVDASGEVLNQYTCTRSIKQTNPPAVPWAVPLASAEGFRLIVFDLDSKRGEAAAAADAAALVELLTEAEVPHLVCRSGPSGGRHVWTATTEPVAPALIGTLARLVAALLPSLDIAPLRNTATGCVRPPGSPHRDGGRSEVLTGTLDCLLIPTIGASEIEQLIRLVAARVTGSTPPSDVPTGSTVRFDQQGHPYLPGSRRPLPPASLSALTTPVAGMDASVTLNRVLLGAAAAHWRLADIGELAGSAAGLEHLRTRRTTRGRTPRDARAQAETLARQWRYAVTYVANHPRQTGLDDTFDTRAGHLADLIRDQQERADASPGRWIHGGGPSDRRVLDCLHLLALTAVDTVVEADIRRIALTCGIGRETARTALARLTVDGWIRQARPAAGVHGAAWQTDPQNVLPRQDDSARSQAATRPEGAGAAERFALLSQLQQRTALASHDVFTGNHALPLAAGNLYARLTPSTSSADLDQHLLNRMAELGVVHRRGTAWVPVEPDYRDHAAVQLRVEGRLQARRRGYSAERVAWAWWQAEHAWMCGPRTRRDSRPRAEQIPLWQPLGQVRYPKHPRGPDGRADYSAARAAVQDGAVSPALTLLVA